MFIRSAEVANDCLASPELMSKRGFLFLEPFGLPGLRRRGASWEEPLQIGYKRFSRSPKERKHARLLV